MALEHAQREIWILDWWLSPELYLRRPPAKNEQYRLDRLLWAAANRGVQVHIIVYKEVTQALTLSSSHTKHWLEDNDKTGNIKVMRHPDHIADRRSCLETYHGFPRFNRLADIHTAAYRNPRVKFPL